MVTNHPFVSTPQGGKCSSCGRHRTDSIHVHFLLGLSDFVKRAQKEANRTGEAYGVWEHVGDSGSPFGDIPARYTFRVIPLNRPDPPRDWAMVATVDPEGV